MISFEEHDGDNDILTRRLEVLTDKEDFEEIPGRYFYNRGATYNQYLNLLERPTTRNPSQFVTYDVSAITGKDVPNWLSDPNNEPTWGFKAIRKYNNGIKFTELISLLMTTRKLFHQKIENAKTRTLPLNQEDV